MDHLGLLSRHVEFWQDEAIEPGMEWHREIVAKLEGARLAICLISPNFLRSRYCVYREFAQLAQRRARGELRLIPILVENCAWREIPLLKVHLEVIHRVPVGDRALQDLASEEVRAAMSNVAESAATTLEEAASTSRTRARRGKKSRFPVDREALFVRPNRFVLIGRELETAALDLAWDSDRIRVLSFVGSGGCGKTTLVRAWLDRIKDEAYRGAGRVLGWSF